MCDESKGSGDVTGMGKKKILLRKIMFFWGGFCEYFIELSVQASSRHLY